MSEIRLYENDYLSIDHDADRAMLVMRWSEATADMTDAVFKDALEHFAAYAAEPGASALLVDVRKFRHPVGDDLGVWRGKEITPRYNDAGVTRFAYIAPPDMPTPPEGEPLEPLAPNEKFLTRFFGAEEGAVAWLTGD